MDRNKFIKLLEILCKVATSQFNPYPANTFYILNLSRFSQNLCQLVLDTSGIIGGCLTISVGDVAIIDLAA